MKHVWVFNNSTNRLEKHYLSLSAPMPYVQNNALTVREFTSNSTSPLVWSDKRFLETFNAFRKYYARPIYVGYAYKRIWEGGHTGQSQHYAGGAFDTGQNGTAATRATLHRSAVTFGEWSYVEPLYLTPTWVHFDKRLGPPANGVAGYPLAKSGSRGVYVLILQDALNAVGFTGSGLDGIFGAGTRNAVIRYQSARGLTADGIVGARTWDVLANEANGIGRTPTVILV